jgi:hypothetical protein
MDALSRSRHGCWLNHPGSRSAPALGRINGHAEAVSARDTGTSGAYRARAPCLCWSNTRPLTAGERRGQPWDLFAECGLPTTGVDALEPTRSASNTAAKRCSSHPCSCSACPPGAPAPSVAPRRPRCSAASASRSARVLPPTPAAVAVESNSSCCRSTPEVSSGANEHLASITSRPRGDQACRPVCASHRPTRARTASRAAAPADSVLALPPSAILHQIPSAVPGRQHRCTIGIAQRRITRPSTHSASQERAGSAGLRNSSFHTPAPPPAVTAYCCSNSRDAYRWPEVHRHRRQRLPEYSIPDVSCDLPALTGRLSNCERHLRS